MMQKLFGRSTALLITLCAVLLSALLGANLSLSMLRSEAQALYNNGGQGAGIDKLLTDTVSDAKTMAILAQHYLDSDNSQMKALDAAVDAYNQAHTVAAKGAAAGLLEEAIQDLDDLLITMDLSGNDRATQDRLKANTRSNFTAMRQNGYNDAARFYNSALRKTPGGMLARLTGLEPLELFE